MNSNQRQQRLLYFLCTNEIVLDERFVTPTTWDSLVVEDDLRHFISESRRIACTPEVSLRCGQVVALNGVPFIRAAKAATPPLESIVCMSSDPKMHDDPRAALANAAELLERDEKQGDFLNVLYFRRRLNAGEIVSVSDAIQQSLSEWAGPGPKTVGHAVLVGRSIVTWRMPASVPEDRRVQRLSNEIRAISREIGTTSWNGINMCIGGLS